MRHIYSIAIVLLFLIILSFFTSCSTKQPIETDNSWTKLLDKDLSKWNIYLSYEMKNGYNGSIPLNVNGDTIQPIGYNNNYKNVFSVISDNKDSLILRISGEVYGCVFTKEDYRNYRFRLKVKWGNLKWEPRLDKAYDSGILYHSQGECGVDYWRTWMTSHEFQLEENLCGDYWCIGQTQIDVRAEKDSTNLFFDNNAAFVTMGVNTPAGYHCQIKESAEKPHGEWNEIELICYEGKSLHIVNGVVVAVLSNPKQIVEEGLMSLDEGKIQLQSEAGEVFYKDIEIKEIEQLPDEYTKYFD